MTASHNALAINQIAALVNVPANAGLQAVVSVFSEQFVTMAPRLAEDEVALFDIVFMEVMRDAAVDDRALLATRLAPVTNAPLKLITALALDEEISVASPVLRYSSRLDNETLLAVASTKGEAHLSSIAMRESVAPNLCQVLTERGTPAVLIVLVNNTGAQFDDQSRSTVVQKAFTYPDLFVEIDHHSAFAKAIMAAYEPSLSQASSAQGASAFPIIQRNTDAEVAGYIGRGQIERALAIMAMEAHTRHRVILHAYQKDTLKSFIIIARAANLSWGTTVGLLLSQFGLATSANQINECRKLFDDTTRREALHTTHILSIADKGLRG